MSDLRILTRRLQRMVGDLARTQAADAAATSQDVMGLVKLRLAQRGTDSMGDQFSDYSDDYASYRRSRGRQSAVKDFNFTGELYRSIHVRVAPIRLGVVQTLIGPRGRDNRQKLRGQIVIEMKKRGVLLPRANPIYPSRKDIETAKKAYEKRRIKRIRAALE